MTTGTPERMLRVNLSTGAIKSEQVPAHWQRRFIGGKGLGARYLYKELDAGTDPLGPNNVLLFMTGPLSGLLPDDPRYAAITKSPLTGAFLDSYSGGTFAGNLAGALGDHLGLLVSGHADEPAIIELEDGNATITPAGDVWGMDAVEACHAFPDAAVACIGSAGEHRIGFATIASDGAEHHAGRGGAGAVMGAKRLKAIVAKGDRPDDLPELRAEYVDRYREDDVGKWQRVSGTLETVDFANEVGVLSTRGWQQGQFEKTDDIGIEAAHEAATEREHKNGSIPGGFRIETDEGTYVPRGATAMSLGAELGIDEFDMIVAVGETCDRLGVDVISAGNAVAWAIRASQNDVIDREFGFGDAEAARTLIEEIATRATPLGDALADGVAAAIATFGGENLVPTVKAMELPAYDPRGAKGMALAYATSDRGGCHRRARPVETEVFGEDWTDEDRVRIVVTEQNIRSVLWSLIADDFIGEVLWDDLGAEWLAAVGREYDPGELWLVGERVWTLIRLFNVREGFSKEDDSLPEVFTEPLSGGPTDGHSIDPAAFESLRERYYAVRDWSDAGYPTRTLLDRLDLTDAVDDQTPIAEHSIGQ
ncbi:aldehyde ferredoxin oxidoreductase family protein [Haladaptatus salinisoli]|uniref:aldehyde ferredoxin oxidoreductase family protein n=1 Tax=Haladaptatus salinisoli TaxID=2884876 RepID=UPI001D0B958F|nr:aldehyde ferredoxin oxidoreductase C-terminal domain-containing protein [Haladaptatus salinisoli]